MKAVKQDWVNELTTYQLARWASLVEGVNLVAESAEERGMAFKKVNFKIPALKKYVDSTCDILARQFEESLKSESITE